MPRTPAEHSKTDVIRQYLARRPNATALEAVRGLKREMGVDVSVGLAAKVKREAAVVTPAASSNGVSKADRIRQVAKGLPKPVRPRDVIAELAQHGVEASSAQVSQVLKSMGLKRRRGAGRQPVAVETVAATLTLESLLAAKKLVNQLGSVQAAKTAVDALAKLG